MITTNQIPVTDTQKIEKGTQTLKNVTKSQGQTARKEQRITKTTRHTKM